MVGENTKKFLSELSTIVERFEKAANSLNGKTSAKRGRPKKEETEDENAEEQSFTEEEEEQSDDTPENDEANENEEEEENETPPKKAAKGKKSLTVDDVNDACKAAASRTNRKIVLGLLKKKFDVTSVSDLAEDDYSKVIKALEALEAE